MVNPLQFGTFRFGAFRLDPLARELFEDGRRVDLPLSTIDCLIYLIRHRDRPVGRDELAAAVWGRVDVSEVSLSHAIMRLRRQLGDDGNAQRIIRTVPRLGYRWVLDELREDSADADTHAVETTAVAAEAVATVEPQAEPAASESDSTVPTATAARPRRGFALAALGAVALMAVAAFALWALRPKPAAKPPVAAANSALVLPVAIDAGEESAWLRLGLMDLVATQLRRGELATTPSETVVALLKARHFADDAEARSELPAAWLVRTQARLAGKRWDVHLQAIGAQRTLDIQTHAADALGATRAAADELLIKLGHTPPNDDLGDATLAAATLRQRVNAALLGGQVDIAQRLIAQAPASLQASPDVALARARVAFFSGDYAGSQQQCEDLLARLPEGASRELRARVSNALGAAAFRQARFDVAQRAFAATITQAGGDGDADVLAEAHRGSGSVASNRGQLETAAQEYGRARTLYQVANDPYGVATVDLNLGINAMQRGQPAAALAQLDDVRARLARLGATDALASADVTLVETRLALLDHDGALAASADFAAPGKEPANPRLRWQLAFARAAALESVGRLAEADTLLARLRDASDPGADALARALADTLAARIALAHGDAPHALEFAEAARTPLLRERNADQYAEATLLHVLALQQSGRTADAAKEIAQWRAAVPTDAGSPVALRLALADAAQAQAEGRSDDALRDYAQAMAVATQDAIPEEMARVGLPYVRALVAARRIDEAVSVNGRIAPWAERDMRAAWSAALVYTALGQNGAAADALERARQLAGERNISDVVTITSR